MVFSVLFLVPSWANDYNYSEEQLVNLKAQALEQARTLMMEEIFNIIQLYLQVFSKY